MNSRKIVMSGVKYAAVAVGLWLTLANVRAQEAPQTQRGTRSAPAAEPSRFAVISLKHANATETQAVLQRLFESESRRMFPGGAASESIIADPRTNSLVVRASEEVLEQITEIVKTLDQPKAEQVKIFSLLHTPVQSTYEALAQIVGSEVRFAVDPASNRVIATGDEGTLDMVEALLLRLDEPPETKPAKTPAPAAQDVQVRLVWLVAGLENPDAAPPPADLENVIKELEALGVTGLKTAAQIFVKTLENTPFEMNGSAMLDQPCALDVTGTFVRKHGAASEQAKSTPMLLEISVGARGQEGANLADLRTTITAPEGHSVVLGVSPVGSLTSVFVVQLRR